MIIHRSFHDSYHWEDHHGLSYTKPTPFDYAALRCAQDDAFLTLRSHPNITEHQKPSSALILLSIGGCVANRPVRKDMIPLERSGVFSMNISATSSDLTPSTR
jgi:hypothetical protein